MVMAVVIPQTDLILLKCPLEEDQQNQLTFTNETAQYNYFSNLPSLSGGNDFTYQRKDGRVRFNADIEDIRDYNYCMYRNDAYSNKWFYCFITDMEYANDGVTFITLKTDVWQTWQFQLNFQNSFVEREHVNSDGVGEHTVPENLDYGEYVANTSSSKVVVCRPGKDAYICMQVTNTTLASVNIGGQTLPTVAFPFEGHQMFTGIPQGCAIYAFDMSKPDELTLFRTIVRLYDYYGKADAIVSIFIAPEFCSTWTYGQIQVSDHTGLDGTTLRVPDYSQVARKQNLGIIPGYPYTTTISGYTPKNNKLFTYPYNYLYLSNDNGADVVYHYEDFLDNTPQFMMYGALEQGGSIFIAPTNSKKNRQAGDGNCWNEGISLGKLPQISWTSNYYLNWQAVNASNIVVQSTLDGLGFVGDVMGALTPLAASKKSGQMNMYKAEALSEGVSASVGLGKKVASTMQQIKQAKLVPDQAKGNISAGSISFANADYGYRWTNMCIRYEYAKMIDDYFSMFGYKVNSLKTPNITGRTNWNYVKTVICNVVGNVPQRDIEEIKAIFNEGITFWHNPSTYLDYSQTNAII